MRAHQRAYSLISPPSISAVSRVSPTSGASKDGRHYPFCTVQSYLNFIHNRLTKRAFSGESRATNVFAKKIMVESKDGSILRGAKSEVGE